MKLFVDESSTKTFMSGSHDQTVHIWQWEAETNSVDCIAACRGHAGSVDCVAIDQTKQKARIIICNTNDCIVALAFFLSLP